MKSVCAAFLMLWGTALSAQEPAFMEAGTHPGSGALYSRLFWTSPPLSGGEGGRERGGLLESINAYGFTARRALLFDLGLDVDGVSEGSLRLKQRFLQFDTGPIDTWRASVHGGVHWREDGDPGARLGLVSTTIRGRHGWNLQLEWNEAEISERRYEANASHLYRIHPVRYAADTTGAWYTMLESLNAVSSDGDVAADVAIGLLYEGRRWACEASIRLIEPSEGISTADTVLGLGARMLW
ncbi:MAG: hypothetical protein JJU29_03920 [Verrucomicrobia bacterium]|nr:hypothetical protein [Verrucomicrobiota bacterium]MCH8512176.1 hypothetical protein [Kiritimatiellia bacterium]